MPDESTAAEGAALPKLSTKHQMFVEQFFLCHLNMSAAARACGYRSNVEGSRLCARPDIAAHIAARMAQHMTGDEVLYRLAAIARVTGDQFTLTQEYEIPIFEPRPLSQKIGGLERQIAQFQKLNAERFKDRIEKLELEVIELEGDLALNPAATYQVQVGTETRKRVVPSLEAAQENGVLHALESIEYTQNGLKWKRQDSLKALELYGKYLKLFTDKVEHSGQVGVLGIDFILPGEES